MSLLFTTCRIASLAADNSQTPSIRPIPCFGRAVLDVPGADVQSWSFLANDITKFAEKKLRRWPRAIGCSGHDCHAPFHLLSSLGTPGHGENGGVNMLLLCLFCAYCNCLILLEAKQVEVDLLQRRVNLCPS